MRWFQGQPTDYGWYFWSEKPEDWDLAKPVQVQQVQRGCSPVVYEVNTGDGRWRNAAEVGGLWYGPIKPPRPHPVLLTTEAGFPI